MTRFRPLKMSLLAAAGVCLTASAALAQVPAPPTVTPIAPPAPPAAELPPPPPPVSSPMAPLVPTAMAAPKSADDLTGSVGFGVGLVANSELFGTNSQVAIKYWMSDNMALVPALNFGFNKTKGVDATWALAPEAVLLFVPFKSTSTRLQIGGGLGINVGKATAASDTTFSFYIPIQAGVEHFLFRWFSMGIAARSNFFAMQTGDPWSISMSINTMSLLGQLFFYTD